MTSIIGDHELLAYNHQGLFPGPEESDRDFLKRVQTLLGSAYSSEQLCPDSLKRAKKLYDIEPSWVQLEYTDQGLRFWEAAAVEVSEKHFRFQLRRTFIDHPKYLGLYCKKEILSHEFSHIGRMTFPSSPFEEIFAFQTSKSFRRFFGPLFSTPRESLTLVVLTSMALLSDLLLRRTPYAWLFFKLAPLFYLIFLGLKLLKAKIQYRRALKKLKKLTKDLDQARYIAYRLTEKEIIKFSFSRLKKIKTYIQEKKNKELRWRLIYLAYIKNLT